MTEFSNQDADPNNPYLISYMTLRKAVGWLGVLLPVVCVLGLIVFHCLNLTDCSVPVQDSISKYYYTKMSSYMVGTLCAVSLFLFAYKGYDKKDNWACNIAGLFALMVAFFPMHVTTENGCSSCIVYCSTGVDCIGDIHFASASLFFITLAYISYFQFTKTSGFVTPQKKKRNNIYRICAITIICSIAILGIYYLIQKNYSGFDKYKPAFWFESISLWAFGISWLTKGEFILKDTP